MKELLPGGYMQLKEGLAVYLTKRSKNYYIYLNLGGIKKQCSLGVCTIGEALELAYGYYAIAKNGTVLESPNRRKNKILDLASLVIEELNNKNRKKSIHEDYKRLLDEKGVLVRNYGSFLITQFGVFEIEEYLNSPELFKSKTQQTMYRTVLNLIFNVAVKYKYIRQGDIPKMPSVDRDISTRRGFFTERNLDLIDSKFDGFIDASRKEITKDRRFLLKQLFNFLIFTGIRPGEEVENIRFSDIELHEAKFYRVKITAGKIHGTYNNFRYVPLHRNSAECIAEVIDYFYLKYGILDHFPADILDCDLESWSSLRIDEMVNTKFFDNFVFCRPEKQELPEHGKTFNQLCEFVGIDKKIHDLSLYSCRHTYITQALESGKEIYLIAKVCGTSVEMIQKYYDHADVLLRSDELIGHTFPGYFL
nr:site-specific integrase [uncultured Tolumonas sp.]